MKRNLLYTLLMQIACWFVFFICDFAEEHNTPADGLVWYAFFVLPILCGVLFCIFEPKMRALTKIRHRFLHYLAESGIWLLESAATGVLMCMLVENDIIPQKSGGWEYFLNGIEYLLFPFALFLIPLCMAVMWFFLSLAYGKIKAYRARPSA